MKKAKRSRRARRAPRKQKPAATAATVARLRRRVAALEKARDVASRRHERQLATLQRATDRQLAGMVREIAALRHHQARAEALTRLVGEREAALVAQTERIARLEGLLQAPAEMR